MHTLAGLPAGLQLAVVRTRFRVRPRDLVIDTVAGAGSAGARARHRREGRLRERAVGADIAWVGRLAVAGGDEMRAPHQVVAVVVRRLELGGEELGIEG